jgi:hypothetical protein
VGTGIESQARLAVYWEESNWVTVYSMDGDGRRFQKIGGQCVVEAVPPACKPNGLASIVVLNGVVLESRVV